MPYPSVDIIQRLDKGIIIKLKDGKIQEPPVGII